MSAHQEHWSNTAGFGHVRCDGLAAFGQEEIDLRHYIERQFAEWIHDFHATEIELPRLLRVEDAEQIDYFRNFPHLGLLVAPLRDPDTVGLRPQKESGIPRTDELDHPRHVLPSAGCYGLYFTLHGTVVPDITLYTLRGHCFRNEAEYDGLDRLLGFTMREVVAVGEREHVEAFVERAKQVLLAGAQQLGVEAELVPGTDPFFENTGARAYMQRVAAVKHELLSSRGVALGSVNFHRNFFGERCDIRLATNGTHAYTACLGFGIERWLSALRASSAEEAV